MPNQNSHIHNGRLNLRAAYNPTTMLVFKHTHFCIGLSSTRIINSLLPGIPCRTSAFRRLSKWGPNMSCNFVICSSLETSANSSKKPCRSLPTINHSLATGHAKITNCITSRTYLYSTFQGVVRLLLIICWKCMSKLMQISNTTTS